MKASDLYPDVIVTRIYRFPTDPGPTEHTETVARVLPVHADGRLIHVVVTWASGGRAILDPDAVLTVEEPEYTVVPR